MCRLMLSFFLMWIEAEHQIRRLARALTSTLARSSIILQLPGHTFDVSQQRISYFELRRRKTIGPARAHDGLRPAGIYRSFQKAEASVDQPNAFLMLLPSPRRTRRRCCSTSASSAPPSSVRHGCFRRRSAGGRRGCDAAWPSSGP